MARPLIFGLFVGLCVAAIGGLAAATFWNVYSSPSPRVSPGVKIADVDVGGVAREDVAALVHARLDRYAQGHVTVQLPGGPRKFKAADLGYRPELAATLAQIEALGVAPRRAAPRRAARR